MFKSGPVKIRDEKDLPENYLKAFRQIALLVHEGFLNGVPMPFGYSRPKIIDDAHHKFDLERQVA